MAADATPSFLYLSTLPAPGSRFELSPEDGHYVARVCRARAGETAEATDGRGALAVLRLIEVRERVVAEVESSRLEDRGPRAWVLCGAPEGERADWLVEKLAELGIERFIPVDCARSTWQRARERRTRWMRLAIAALRQSRQLHLMGVEAPRSLAQGLGDLPGGAKRWLAEEDGQRALPDSRSLGELSVGLVGPAGGLEGVERALALAAGFRPLRLARARLRTETAAVAWASWWAAAPP